MRDPILAKTIAESDIAKRKMAKEIPAASNLNRKNAVTNQTQMGAIPMMAGTIISNVRTFEANAADQRAADGCPENVERLTQIVPLWTQPPHYRKVRALRVVVAILIRNEKNVAKERTRASSAFYVF